MKTKNTVRNETASVMTRSSAPTGTLIRSETLNENVVGEPRTNSVQAPAVAWKLKKRKNAIDIKQFWVDHGTTVKAIKLLPNNPAANDVRAVWDYRAEGLTVDGARQVITKYTRTTNPYGSGGYQRGRRKHRGDVEHHEGRYLRMMQQRIELKSKLAELLKVASTSEWIEGNMDWRNTVIILPLPDGGCVVTTRHEHTQWTENRHWPTSREVTYSSRRLSASGSDVGDSYQHDRRGGWHGRVLVALGLLQQSHVDDRTDMARRLNPACDIRHEHHVGNYTLAQRCVAGSSLDVVASAPDGTAFHASDASEAVTGLRRKLSLKSARLSGSILSARIARNKWGFCLPGLKEFSEATGLSLDDEYTIDEVRQRVTDEVRELFAGDLAIAGI
jgi:hypothetical protein